MAVSLGINPITWTNDDMPELGGDIPLDTCLAETRIAGYAGIELGGKFPREANVLRPILATHGLELVSGWYSAHLCRRSVAEEVAAVAPHLDLLAAMGCKVMVFAEGHGSTDGDPSMPLSRRPVLATDAWPAFCAKLNAIAAHLRQRGVRLAFHHHMGTVVETEAEIDRLMANTHDDVGLLLDTGHLVFAGGDPASVARRHGARIVHVHCKDVRSKVAAEVIREDKSFLRAVLDGIFTVPGDGSIDFAAVLRELVPFGYGGWLVVEAEQDPAKAHPLTYARMGFENLKRAGESAGFAIRPRRS
jgi:inosose dehydratase